VDVETVAEELYQEDPSAFVAQRDARVAAARQEGDRPAADAIKAFKRPSAPAWAVNLLARAHPDEMEALADLGSRLRQAQNSLSGEDLRVLSRERHKFIVGLARQAQRLVAGQGRPLSAAAGRQVEDTLNAALAGPDAAAAAASGRLVRSLEHAGLGPVDLDGAVAGPAVGVAGPTAGLVAGGPAAAGPAAAGPAAAGPAAAGAATSSRARQAEPPGDDSAAARLAAELGEMRVEAAAAEERLRSADLAARDASSAFERASDRQAAAEAEVRRLAGLMEAARSEAETAKAEVSAAAGSRKDAERSVDAARRRAREAQERLTALEDQKSTARNQKSTARNQKSTAGNRKTTGGK
jgi:hypothetical protein